MGRLNDLVTESYTIAKEHGWHDEERSLAALTLLMQSEVAEILEEYRKHKGLTEIWYEVHHKDAGVEVIQPGKPGGKPCGIPVELADLVIRVADYCGKYNIDLESWADKAPRPGTTIDFEEWLARINYALSMAWADTAVMGVAFWLGLSVCYSFSLAQDFGIDLWAVIDEKTAFNRTRPYRHGGKRI
jgi:NTP pyrophosphatase (non-canonical NTP hydrolase)